MHRLRLSMLSLYFVQVVTLTAIYFVLAVIGLKIGTVSNFATLVWLPSGISLASLLIFGNNLWPGIFLGALFANIYSGAPAITATDIAVGNTLEAVIAYYLLSKKDFRISLYRVKDVLNLVLYGAIFSTVISATVGTTSLFLSGLVNYKSYLTTWFAWWIGDMISDLIIAPLILTLSDSLIFRSIRKVKIIELIVALIILLTLELVTFYKPSLVYLVFPPLIWISIRFSQKETIAAVFILSFMATIGTALRLGSFVQPELSRSLLLLQLFMSIISVTFMILSAAIKERSIYEKSQSDLVMSVGHELKTPITTIKLLLALQKTKSREKIRYLGKIKFQTDQLIQTVNYLLRVSKIDHEDLPINKNIFSLAKLIVDKTRIMQKTTKKHTLITYGLNKKKVFADETLIGEVFINILSNAIKYSPCGGKITISSHIVEDRIITKIQDRGIGIKDQEHEKIFDRFFKSDDVMVVPGIGIGLYLSKEIVVLHGGKIWFESTRGRGSAFYFSLPLPVNKLS